MLEGAPGVKKTGDPPKCLTSPGGWYPHCAENVTVTNGAPEPIRGCRSQTSTQASFPFEYRDIGEPIAAAYNSLPNTSYELVS